MSHARPAAEVLLEMHGITKQFGAVPAIAGVDLRVLRGEVHALIGENGAGKSTLMKVLSGALRADSGEINLAGAPYRPRDPSEARDLGVCMIYQELTLAGPLTVAENLFLGREIQRYGVRDRAAMRSQCERALAVLAQPDLTPDRRVSELAPAARQLVEIARALVFDARVVVMDEPTSSLSQREVERLFEIIARLRARGVAVIYISHFLDEIRRVAERYTVLRDGLSVATGDVTRDPEQADAFDRRVLQLMAGRAPAEAAPRARRAPGPLRLELRDVSGRRLPQAASFGLRGGEILGIFGLMGAGRSELLRAVFGLDAKASGSERTREDAPFEPFARSPARRWRQGIGLVSENRKDEGLALGLSICENLTLSRPPARWGFLAVRERDARTRELGTRLALRFPGPRAPVGALSGGNQQKVALLRLLHHDVDVYLLDEPTRGIDVASKTAIYGWLGELAARGKAVLVVSSYLPELLGLCDRIAVMCRGRLSPAEPISAWTSERLLAMATASDTPDAP